MDDIKKFAVIVAGGKGVRMGNAVPKQFLELCGKPVLAHSIIAFMQAFPGIEIILVLPQDMLSYAQIVFRALPEPIDATIIAGGATRFHSVQNGLNAISGEGVVFVHDGARPLISTDLLHRCYKGAIKNGCAIPVIAVAESLRSVSGDGSSTPVNRDNIRVVQTPQTFLTHRILPAFRQEYDPSFTDEATVAENYGIVISLVEGEKKNIKITLPEDMIFAEAILNANS